MNLQLGHERPTHGCREFRRTALFNGLVTVVLAFVASGSLAGELSYPVAPVGDVVDRYHGVEVADPWRWLEEVDSAETRRWVEANQQLTENYLEALPGRETLQKRLEEIWDLPKYGLPQTVGSTRYYEVNDGLQPQPILYREQIGSGQRVPLLDISRLSEDGTTALKSWRVSPDGQFLAYGYTEAGEDWTHIRIRDIRTGEDLEDKLSNIKFSNIAWTKNSQGFIYARFPERRGTFGDLENQALYFHRVGTAQAEDVLVFSNAAKPRHNYWASIDRSGRWMLVSVFKGASDNNALVVRDLRDPADPRLLGPNRVLVRDYNSQNTPIGIRGNVLYVLSTQGASRGAVRAIDLGRSHSSWQTVVAETEDTLRDAELVGDVVVTHHLRMAASVLTAWSLEGQRVASLTPPDMGAVDLMSGDDNHGVLFFSWSSTVAPVAVWYADLRAQKSEPWRAPHDVVAGDRFVTEQHFARSKDGTQVPYFLAREKSAQPNRSRPTWLYGYGGFNIPTQPEYRVYAPLWLEAGGIFVIANMRGGGEFGESWHEAGTKLQKQNVFDDFIAVAEDLIAKGWTSPEQLAIHGRSNGGLLVGAVTNQRPDLFGAAMPGVGVMDMLRFHKFTIGWAWTGDYGSSDDPQQFAALRKFSPVHNVAVGQDYPPVMAYTADHDDRVVPGHSFKYAAALQNTETGSKPTLIRIESQGGHGTGKPTSAQIAEARDLLLFAGHHTGINWGVERSGSTPWSRLTGR